MFNGCSSLTGLTVPASVTGVGSYHYEYSEQTYQVFSGCTSLTSITALSTTAPVVTSSTFNSIATGGTLYYPEGSDYSSWLYYLGYYLWNQVEFNLESVSTYFMQFQYNATGTSNAQSVFITANKPDYQVIASDVQNTTGNGVTWLTVSGTPASGYTEFKAYPTSSAETQRNCWIQVVYSGNILATIAVQQLGYSSADTGTSEVQITHTIPETADGYLYPSNNRIDFLGTINPSTSAWFTTVNSNVDYVIECSDTWFAVSGTPTVGDSRLKIYPTSNNTTSNSRWGYVYLKYNGVTYQTFTIKQIPSYEITSGVSYATFMYTGDTEIAASVTGVVCQVAIYVPSRYNTWEYRASNVDWPDSDLQRSCFAPEGEYLRYAYYSMSPYTGTTSRSCTYTLTANGTGVGNWTQTQLGA